MCSSDLLGLIGRPRHAPRQFGAFSIEPPAVVALEDRTRQYWNKQLPKGLEVLPVFDPRVRATGSSIFEELKSTASSWVNREMIGAAVLPDGSLLHTCAHDWYNVAETQFPSHCLSFPNPVAPGAVGPFSFSCGNADLILCHAQQVSTYVSLISDQNFSDRVFAAIGFSQPGEPVCLTGMMRSPAGKPNKSQGMSLYAFRCYDLRKLTPPGPIEALPLIHHPSQLPFNINTIKWPAFSSPYKWSPKSKCHDIVWGRYLIEQEDGSHKMESGLFVTCKFGGGVWWYGARNPWAHAKAAHRGGVGKGKKCYFNKGNPQTADGRDCSTEWYERGEPIPPDFTDPCPSGKGTHGVFPEVPHYRGIVLFYRAQDLALSALASHAAKGWAHLENVPFQIILDTPETLWPGCPSYSGIAFDTDTNKLFIVQDLQKHQPIIHVYQVENSPKVPDYLLFEL